MLPHRFLPPPLLSLTIPIPKDPKMRPHHQRKLDKLLHAIHQPIPIRARQEATPPIPSIPRAVLLLRKLRVRHGHGALVRNRKHAHPATQHAQRVHRVERLRAAAHLGDGQGAALGGAHGAGGEGDPVDLVFEDGGLGGGGGVS